MDLRSIGRQGSTDKLIVRFFEVGTYVSIRIPFTNIRFRRLFQ